MIGYRQMKGRAVAQWRSEFDDQALSLLADDARREALRQGKSIPVVELKDKLIRTLNAAEAGGVLLTDMELAAVLSTYVCNCAVCPQKGDK